MTKPGNLTLTYLLILCEWAYKYHSTNVEAREQLEGVNSRLPSAGATRAVIPYGISQVLELNLITNK